MGENRERAIEDAVIAHPDALGYPGASAIRNVRIGWGFGRIDVMLFPRTGATKIVLVEAKHTQAPDAISKVLGQLLMYYAGALAIGSVGLECLQRYAELERERALGPGWISPLQLTGGVSPPTAAWKVIASGDKLRAGEVALFVALNAAPHSALETAVNVLREEHQLRIGLVVVENGLPRLHPGARSNNSLQRTEGSADASALGR